MLLPTKIKDHVSECHISFYTILLYAKESLQNGTEMVKGERKGQKKLAYSHKLSGTNLELLNYLKS